MSDIYAKLYNTKKEQLTTGIRASSPKPVVNNIEDELMSKRSETRSETPTKRCSSIAIDRKVLYKHDLDSVKQKIEELEKVLLSVDNKIKEVVENCKKDLEAQIEKQKNVFESLKTENLKNLIGETVKQFNENQKNIANELITHLDMINTLREQVTEIEAIL